MTLTLTRIAVHLVTQELRVPFTTSFGTQQTLRRPFVLLETTDGRRGLGEVPTLADPAYKPESDTPAVLTSLREFLLPAVAKAHRAQGGIADIEALRASYGWVKGAVFAKSGIEAALWDLTAQHAEAPLWRLWGGDRRTFDVGVSIGGKTLDQVLELAENAAALGYRRLKVKIWPGFDVEVATELRRRFPDLLLQVDANSAYDQESWRALKGLDDLGLLLIEQPLYDDDIVLHSRISRELATPVCLDESIHSVRDAETAIALWTEQDAVDRLVINIKPPRVGGFQEAIAIARACQDAGVRTWIGGMLDSGWGKAFNLNLNALSAFDLPGDHFSPTGAYFVEDVITEPLIAREGWFTLGDGVSAGVEVDWERFDRMATELFAADLAG